MRAAGGRFNLLFYGLGSKKDVLDRFADDMLTDGPLVLVDGYMDNIAIKQVCCVCVCVCSDRLMVMMWWGRVCVSGYSLHAGLEAAWKGLVECPCRTATCRPPSCDHIWCGYVAVGMQSITCVAGARVK